MANGETNNERGERWRKRRSEEGKPLTILENIQRDKKLEEAKAKFNFQDMPYFVEILNNIKKIPNRDRLIFDILQQRSEKLNEKEKNNIRLPKEISPIGKPIVFKFQLEQLQFLIALYLRNKAIKESKNQKEKEERTKALLSRFVTDFLNVDESKRKSIVGEKIKKQLWNQRDLLQIDSELLDSMHGKWKKISKLEKSQKLSPIQQAILAKERDLVGMGAKKPKRISWIEEMEKRRMKQRAQRVGGHGIAGGRGGMYRVILILLAIISLYFLFLQ